MKYNATKDIQGATDVYFNHELHYPHGALVTVNGEVLSESKSVVDNLNVICTVNGTPIDEISGLGEKDYSNHVLITPTEEFGDSIPVSITITKCGLAGKCTCRR